jgi:hypothetical protein
MRTDERYHGQAVIFNGMSKDLAGWAAHYGRTPASLANTARQKGSLLAALEWCDKTNRHGIKIYTYTGEPFVAASGRLVQTDDTHTLCEWGKVTGIAWATIRSRCSREISSPQEAFNRAITEPVKHTACHSKDRPNKPIRKGLPTIEILKCRAKATHGCSPCQRRAYCYAEVTA